ncbi:hypothetical protein F8388_004733 [Cannabis sativa]|uniref:GCK domain-containing protein n=1 Tax=Cannabis sativa TaxID=3483 RepID=A0A7J6HP15_CANSA|nr:hypothetical protein F8388_004733 [Cannabis sativa]
MTKEERRGKRRRRKKKASVDSGVVAERGFIAWENCIEEAEKKKEDIVEKCFQVTGDLKKCMEAHADYYEPILKAEKAAEEEVAKELEKEEAAKDSEQNAAKEDELRIEEATKDSEQNAAVAQASASDSDNSQGVSAEKHDGGSKIKKEEALLLISRPSAFADAKEKKTKTKRRLHKTLSSLATCCGDEWGSVGLDAASGQPQL